nr:hypothetical protein [Streptococcus pyogenes]
MPVITRSAHLFDLWIYKLETAYEFPLRLLGSEMWIRDSKRDYLNAELILRREHRLELEKEG